MAKSWYALATTPDGDGHAEILIYDGIGDFGIPAADFVKDLAAIDDNAPITVRINSEGGSVFDGIAILNSLRAHPGKVTVVVDGIAASIASVIAMGGDEIVMNKSSQMMIHNAWSVGAGNADELQKIADGLRSMSTNIAGIYAERTGGTVDDWRALMDAETWYTADEAVAAGLADMTIVETIKFPQMARASLDLSRFKYAGREAAPAPTIMARNQTPQPQVEAEVPNGKEPPVATLNESLVEKLGLDAEADDESILAEVVKLTERPEKVDEAPPVVVEPTTEAITAAAAKMGLALVDREQYATTIAAVARLEAKDAAEVKATDERLINDAIKDGKLAPANRSNWLALMDKDRVGIRATLAQLPKGLIPVAEMGHGTGSELDHLDTEMAAGYTAITGKSIGKDA
jgi:ATP-dependent protease ClpP protease subunit